MRDAFSKCLVEAGRSDPRVLLLTGDHGYALFDDFRRVCPGQYINAGVAEQNMVGVAAGLAKGGFRPFVYGLSAFVPVRVLEQIKLDVCYEQLPVVFIGDGAGVVYGQLGSSHQSTEDVAALRAVPHMAILSPADAHEMTSAMRLAMDWSRPVYLRMGKADLGAVHNAPPQFDWGRLCPVRPGPGPIAWIATGSMATTALKVAADWPGSPIWSAPCIKPLDEEQVAGICREHAAVVVLEEHSVYGGLGSAVAEIAASHAPTWVCRVGIQDRFSAHCGGYPYLMREHGLDAESVGARVEHFLSDANIVGASPRSIGRRAA
ncbi:MAG TPA: transketolase C-terminal domain-containing protein [Pirellulales bacterium]|jgi:transketolase|nr:transketolase C-terminal domain-containing protein [Pirellulales bacterium]